MQIQDMRAALDNLRPSRDEKPQMSIGSAPRALERVVLDTEDIGAIATRYREEGHRVGFQAGAEETRAWQEAVRADAVRRAETLGVLAGLQAAVNLLNGVIPNDPSEPPEASVRMLLADLQDAFAAVASEGLHGERADQATDMLERVGGLV